MAANGSTERSVVLYTREGCHLCVDARTVVAEECVAAGREWVEVDVDSDDEAHAAYSHYVPAVVVDGVQVAFWQIDRARLRYFL